MANSRILILLLTIFFATSFAQAQQPAENAELREKAYKLLESVAGQLGTLQSAENRARLGANVADSLWDHDEPRARSLFQQVEADIRSELQKWQPQTGNDLTLLIFLKLRAETVERIARHDGAAALAFLRGTEIKSDQLPKQAVNQLRNIEMVLAQRVAADNPEAAVVVAREALARGYSYDLVTLLRRLNWKHKGPAQTLYKEIVNKLQDADLERDWDARYFAASLAQTFRPPVANEAIYRELIAAIVTNALKNGCGNKIANDGMKQNYCQSMASLVPGMEKFDARAAQIRHWSLLQDPDQTQSARYELAEAVEFGTQEEILAAARKYPAYAERVYQDLIERAWQVGNADDARKLINTYITDPEKRRDALARLDSVSAPKPPKKIAIDEAELVQLEETFKTITEPANQVGFLLRKAQQFARRDQKLALKLADRASDLVDAMKPDKAQTRAQIDLAELYCYGKNERGLGLMESLVPKLNELVELAAKLDGYETNYLRDGEWNMSANGSVGALLTQLSHTAHVFAWYDFDRAVTLAGRFERPEIRLMAHVRLAQGILSGPPQFLILTLDPDVLNYSGPARVIFPQQ